MPDANGRFRGITVPRLPWIHALAGDLTAGLNETQDALNRMVGAWAGDNAGGHAPDDENEVAP